MEKLTFFFQLSPSLNLSTFHRCLVTEVEDNPLKFEKIIHLRDKKSQLTGRCILKSVWYDTEVAKFDVVSVRGIWDDERKVWEAEVIVTSPDTLVSGTTVVGSLFCARKSVLAEKFRPLDTGEAVAVSS